MVDNFQGQEVPIVIISMVTSSAEYLPRNIVFTVKIDSMLQYQEHNVWQLLLVIQSY